MPRKHYHAELSKDRFAVLRETLGGRGRGLTKICDTRNEQTARDIAAGLDLLEAQRAQEKTQPPVTDPWQEAAE